MPSGSSSPVLQPGSPLSPKMASLLMPPQARRAPRRQNVNDSLKLPSLPRYHPAHFQSPHTSAANTPMSGLNSPQPPMSPRSQQRQYSDAQRQLYTYQRELVATARGGRATVPGPKPASPRLIPLAGSPGPVTPLELENQADGYLFVGAGSPNTTKAGQAEHIEKLIREEAARRELSSLQPSSPMERR